MVETEDHKSIEIAEMDRIHNLLLGSLLASSLSVSSHATDWKLASDQQGIQVYTQHVAGQDLKNFRATMTVNAPMQQVVATLMNGDQMPEWFHNVLESKPIQTTAVGSYRYLWIKSPWPADDRDAVVKVNLSQDPKTLKLLIFASAAPNLIPVHPDRVRIPRMQSGWTVTPLGKTRTHIQLDGNADPGGRIPVVVANIVVSTVPKISMRQLKTRVEVGNQVDLNFLKNSAYAKAMLAGVVYP